VSSSATEASWSTCARASRPRVHAVLAKEGVAVPMTDLFGVGGQRLLDEVELLEQATFVQANVLAQP